MSKSCARFQPVKPDSESHNRRTKKLDYVRQDLSKRNDSWIGVSIPERLAELKRLVKEKTGRAMQAKATPIREAVVLIRRDTTTDDLLRLAAIWHELYGLEVLQIHVHRDEGHFDKKGRWVPNLHAHMPTDFTDHATGKSLKLSPQQMAELQDVTAEVLGMERGVSSNRKHLTALQFKVEAQRKELAALQKEMDSLSVSKAVKDRLLAFLGNSAADKLIDAQKAEIAALSDDLELARADVAAADQKAVTAAEKAVREALTKVAKAAGLYVGRDPSRIGIVELTRDLEAMRTTEDSLAKEISKLRETVKKLSQEPQSNNLARGL